MKTVAIGMIILFAILGIYWIVSSPSVQYSQDTDRISKTEVKAEVERVLKEQKLPDQTDRVEVGEIRTSDDGKHFKIYLTTYDKDGSQRADSWIIQRDEYGVWTCPTNPNFNLKEKQ